MIQQPDNQPDPQDLPDQSAEPGQEELADNTQQMAQLQAEVDDLQDRILRLSADYQNFARRTQQNINDARQQQVREMARSLVAVLDHFDRALTVDPQATGVAALLQGMQMVRAELLKALEQFEVRRMGVQVGEAFDPERHEALMRQAGTNVASNHITQELQPGYTLGERTLRPAKVAVAE